MDNRFNSNFDDGFEKDGNSSFGRGYGSSYGGGYGSDYSDSFNASSYGSGMDDIYYGDKQFPSRRTYLDSEDEFKRCPGKEVVGLVLGIIGLIYGVIIIITGSAIRSLITKLKNAYSLYGYGTYTYSSPSYSSYKISLFIYGAFAIVLFFVVGVLKRKVYDQADIVTKKIDTGFTLSIIGAVLAGIGMIIGLSA